MTNRNLLFSLVSLVLACGLAFADDHGKRHDKHAGKDEGYYKTFIIEVDHGSDSDGEVVVTIEPYEQEEIVVTIPIEDGTRENRIANFIEETLKEQLDGKYKVERDDYEKVIIRQAYDSPRFKVAVSNSVNGIALELRGK